MTKLNVAKIGDKSKKNVTQNEEIPPPGDGDYQGYYQKPAKKKKPTTGALFEEVFKLRKKLFKKALETWEPSPGISEALLVEQSGLAVPTTTTVIAKCIQKYVHEEMAEDFAFTWAECKACADFLVNRIDPIPRPADVRFEGEEGISFCRPGLTLAPGPMPTWDEFLSRVSNTDAVKAFIGSLFEPKAHMQQFLWMIGDGGDGKGSLFRFLVRVMGSAAMSQQRAPWMGENEHWAKPYLDKRLAIFPDYTGGGTLDNPIFKALTGGDLVEVNPKFKDPYYVYLNVKLMFSANEPPKLKAQKSHHRRAIIARVAEAPADDGKAYEERLWAEGGAFLHSCIEAYKAQCPDHGPITSDEESRQTVEDWAERDDDIYQHWFDSYFIVDATERVTVHQVTDAITLRFGHAQIAHRAARDWLRRKGFEIKTVKEDKKAFKGIPGIRRIVFNADPNESPSGSSSW